MSIYDDVFGRFDSPLMRRIREEAYGEDIGQHSWATAAELRELVPKLRLSGESRLLDLGCGPGGPITFLARESGCRGMGVDLSEPAIESARQRARESGVSDRTIFAVTQVGAPIPAPGGALDAAIMIDVVLHLRDRAATFRELARVLVVGGRFAFTDAGVITGTLSTEEIARRALHAETFFVPPGFNERALEETGFRVLEATDRTPNLLANANGRLASRLAHRAELEAFEGADAFASQRRYLETVIATAERRALSRMMYLAERMSVREAVAA